MDAVVEDAARRRLADPGQPGAVQVRPHLIHPHPRMSLIHVVDVQGDQAQQLLALDGGQLRSRECPRNRRMTLSRQASVRLSSPPLVELQYRPGALCLAEIVDEPQPALLLFLQDRRALVLSRCGDHRLRPGEEGCHHHLVPEHEIVDDGVVAVELPAPGFGRRRLAHHGDVIAPLAVFVEVAAGHFRQRVVQPHDVAGLLHALRAQRCLQQCKRQFALRRCHLEETDSLARVETLVHPLAPLRIVHRKQRPAALGLGEAGEELLPRPGAPAPWSRRSP